ncbi:MAG: hypothetical protein ACI915_002894 [Gammaproteobacteria bacterium]|jgi:hypothetical protein
MKKIDATFSINALLLASGLAYGEAVFQATSDTNTREMQALIAQHDIDSDRELVQIMGSADRISPVHGQGIS